MSQEGNKQTTTTVAANLKSHKVLQVNNCEDNDSNKHNGKDQASHPSLKSATSGCKPPQMGAASAQTTQSKLEANLHSAANEGKVELVRLLLRCGADANAQDAEFGNTALHRAAWNGFSETVQVLCKYRANTSIKNKAQFTPLHMACQQGHNQTVRLLLMANAKTDAKNNYGDTPLHTAARYGHAGAARILLSARCNPNLVNKNHDTPLHIAAAMSRRKLTKILVQNGAELAIKNKQNETAMDIALRKDLIDIQELIANPPPVKQSSRHLRCANDNLHLSELELRYGQLYGGGPLQLQADQQLPTAMQIIRHQQQNHNKRPHGHNLQSSAARNSAAVNAASSAKDRLRQSCDDLSSCENMRARSKSRTKTRIDQATPEPTTMVTAAANNSKSHSNVRLVSARSMAALGSSSPHMGANKLTHKRPHHRTMTLASGAVDLHLLPASHLFAVDSIASSSARRQTQHRRISSAEPQGLVSGEERDEMERGRACPPDARPADWTMGMMRPPPAPSTSHLSDAADQREKVDESVQVGEEGEKKQRKKGSPNASLRSSVAGSRKSGATRNRRLPVKRQRGGTTGGYRHRSSLLIKRSNMGKLTLMRLRNMVNTKRSQLNRPDGASKPVEQTSQEQEAIDDAVPISEVREQQDNSENEDKRLQVRPAAGRRQERLEKLSRESTGLRAPNGTKLLAARPLASLNDDTQLYAVPQKPKVNKQQVPSEPATGGDGESKSPGSGETSDFLCIKPDEARVQNEDPYTPGYSMIRERSIDTQGASLNEPPCSCGDHNERKVDVSDTDSATNKSSQQQVIPKQQQVASNKPTSKFRQLFGHSGDQKSTEGDNQHGSPKTKSSWLKSKFSLSSNNLATREATNNELDSDQVDTSIISADPLMNGKQNSSDPAVRPKSVVSQSNAELIAAQKSLAAAAAAKVKRDRQYKIPIKGHQHMIPAAQMTSASGANPGVLTVKTSEPNFWAHHQPLVVAAGNQAGGKYMHSLMLNNHHHQRSGTNSVGMSDSSPSNNGAESDNSIQTTTGSLNTDNTSSETAAETHQPEGPLGILSRILLNNKGLGALRASSGGNNSKPSQIVDQTTDSSGSTTLRNASISSSSALSSPSSDEQQQKQVSGKLLLDQLSSRSRCPIVLSKSNELPDSDETKSDNKMANELPAVPAPRLPAKSALRTKQNGSYMPEHQHVAAETLSGLPRVASYTHLPGNEFSDQMTRQQSLCNYHLSRYPQQHSYLPHNQQPYSPYTANGFHLSHHDLRAIGNQSAIDFNHLPASAINYEYYLDAPASAYHLAGAANYQPPVGSYLPPLAGDHSAAAIYGLTSAGDDSVYISSSGNASNGLSRQSARGGQEFLIGGAGKRSALPYNNLQHPASYTSDAVYQNQQQFVSASNRLAVHNNPHNQQRPKSSLDTILYSSLQNGHNSTNATQLNNQSATTGADCLRRPHLDAGFSGLGEPIKQSPSSLHSQHQQKPPLPTYYMASTQALSRRQQQHAATGTYLYSENSIYASDQSATSFNQHSDLTVLPTTSSTTPTTACSNINSTKSATASASASADNDSPNRRSQSSCTDSTSSTSPALVAATDDATATGKDKKMMTEIAYTGGDQSVFVDELKLDNQQQHQAQATGKKETNGTAYSWKPAANNYRSLVQVNQSPSANQSSSSQVTSLSSNTKVLTVPAIDSDEQTPIIGDKFDGRTSSFAAIAKQQVVISCGNSDILHLTDDFSGSTIL